jgi:hypothetical protein
MNSSAKMAVTKTICFAAFNCAKKKKWKNPGMQFV